jgi:hypothetical protein
VTVVVLAVGGTDQQRRPSAGRVRAVDVGVHRRASTSIDGSYLTGWIFLPCSSAAELLFSRVDGHDGPSRRIVHPAALIRRGSGELPGPM